MLTLSEVLLVYSSVPSMYLPLWAHPSAPLFIEMNMNISHLHLHFAFLPVLPRLRPGLISSLCMQLFHCTCKCKCK